MALITVDELYSVIIEEELQGKFPGAEKGTVDNAKVLKVVEDAENEILHYIGSFSDPVTATEKVWIKDLTAYRMGLRFHEDDNETTDWYKLFLKRMEKVRDEKAVTTSSSTGVVKVSSNTRVFTRDDLGGF